MSIADPATLRDLLARVKACSAPDRELDAAILEALGLVEISEADAVIGREPINRIGAGIYAHPAPITRSIDAARGLGTRLVPWGMTSGRSPDGRIHAWVFNARARPPVSGPSNLWFEATRTGGRGNEALACCEALLSALLATASPVPAQAGG